MLILSFYIQVVDIYLFTYIFRCSIYFT